METFQDIESIQDMEIILGMEIILDMEAQHNTLYRTNICKMKQLCRRAYRLYTFTLH